MDALAVDRPDHIPRLQARLGCRGVRDHLLDHGQVRARESDQYDREQQAQQEIGHGSRRHRCDPGAARCVGKGMLVEDMRRAFALSGLRLHNLLFIESVHPVKQAGTADGQKPDTEIRLLSFFTIQDGSHADVKFYDPDAVPPRDGKMAELM